MKFNDVLGVFDIIGDPRVFCTELKGLVGELGDLRLTENQLMQLYQFIAGRLVARSDDRIDTTKMLCVEIIEKVSLVKIVFVDVEEVLITDKVEFTIRRK